MKNSSRSWIRVSLLILLILIFTSVTMVMANEGKDDGHREEKGNCDGHQLKFDSILDLKQINVDATITGATPNWIFLVAGKDDKKQLLKIVKGFDVSKKQKNRWIHLLEDLWEKYPIKVDDNIIKFDLPSKKGKKGITLTKEEEKVLGELSDKIAEQMDTGVSAVNTAGTNSADIITPQWAVAQHNAIIYIAAQQENVPEHYAKIAGDSSGVPDNVGFPIQQVTHYFNPDFLTGLAPAGCQLYAGNALNDYRNRRWDSAFTQLGYSSHFLADVGNPMHTGSELTQGATTLLDLKIHNAYEEYVYYNWQNMFESSVDNSGYALVTSAPYQSTTQMAKYSHGYLFELNLRIYLNWLKNGGKFDLNQDAKINFITSDCLTMTTRYMRGLVRYLTINGPVYFIITPSAGPHGSITPSAPIDVVFDQRPTFTFTPNPGYTIDQVFVNSGLVPSASSYTFPRVESDQTIQVTFKSTAPPPSSGTEWIWSRDGWGDWQHTASWSGTQVGPNSEYGPVIVNGHGEHGTNTNLLAGSTQASVWRTFSDSSGTGWNTLTFDGMLPRSDVPGGRWMTIDVNGQRVLAVTELNIPPDQWSQPFEITVQFPQTTTATVKISHGQNPAWGPIFYLEYDKLRLSQGTGSLMNALSVPQEIPATGIIVENMTATVEPTETIVATDTTGTFEPTETVVASDTAETVEPTGTIEAADVSEPTEPVEPAGTETPATGQ